MDEQTRKRQEICSNLLRETEHYLRVVYQSLTPVRLETESFSTLDNQFWLLPPELSKLLHKIHSVMDEENDLIGRSNNRGVSFRRNDLWAFLRTDLSKLEEELRKYETTLKPEASPAFTNLEVKNSERLLLLRKVLDGLVVLAIGRELHEKYCLEFDETGYDKNYKYLDEQKAAAVTNSILTDEQLLTLFMKYREQLRPYWDFSGQFYTYQGKTRMLTLESAWPNFERILDDLFNKHGRATYAVLKAYIQVRKDNYPWSACDYKQLEYVAKELGGSGWRDALTALEVHGVVEKRGSGRRSGERSIALELIPLVQQILSKWEKEHPESISAKLPETLKLERPIPSASDRRSRVSSFEYAVFICHASEDKKEVAEPLARMLMNKGLKVWYDVFKLKVGDSLRRKIDEGLAHSRYGIVILSPSFFKKNWPQVELDGLAAREDSEGHKVILPVWHHVNQDDVVRYSPPLAGRLALKTIDGLEAVLNELLEVIVDSKGNQSTVSGSGNGTQAKAVPEARLVPISPFSLSPDLEKKFKVVRGYTAAFAIYWNKDSLWIDMWYDPGMPAGFGPTDLGGSEIDAADFLDIVHLNPALKRYEFGLTGKPRNALVVIIDGGEPEAWVAPLRLVDTLMGIESDRIRKAIRALV